MDINSFPFNVSGFKKQIIVFSVHVLYVSGSCKPFTTQYEY